MNRSYTVEVGGSMSSLDCILTLRNPAPGVDSADEIALTLQTLALPEGWAVGSVYMAYEVRAPRVEMEPKPEPEIGAGPRLIRVWIDLGRGREVFGIFAEYEDDRALIARHCEAGTTIRLGEVFGKHGNAEVIFEADDFEVLSEDRSFIDQFVEVVGPEVGHGILAAMIRTCPGCGLRDECECEDRGGEDGDETA